MASDERNAVEPPASVRRQWVRGPLRVVVAALAVAAILFGAGRMYFAVRQKPPRDTLVHARSTGGGIPVYLNPTSAERVHWIEPGTSVFLGEGKRPMAGPRCQVFVPMEHDIIAYGFVDAKDLVAEDLARVREELSK